MSNFSSISANALNKRWSNIQYIHFVYMLKTKLKLKYLVGCFAWEMKF